MAGLVILGLFALDGGVALAGGGGGSNSAGNSQYVDPLSGNGHKGTHHSGSSSGTSSSSGTTSSSTTSSSSGTSSPLSQSAPTSVSGTPVSTTTSSKTLPYTGLNLWACVAVGMALLAAGLGLRRVLARTY